MLWQQTALAKYLRTKNPEYFGKIGELRAAVEDWLAYVVYMFPHYTNHTVKHSDEIILQLSKMLFRDEDSPKTIVENLSATEVYILMAAAYLHDIGMVVAPADQRQVLESEQWKKWLQTDEKASKKWADIQALRARAGSMDVSVRHLIADIQTKYLIAEQVRRSHHLRAVSIMTEHESHLGRFAFGDHQLLLAISEVCVGHGLDRRVLSDNRRFPSRTDIRGDKVNLKFLAVLLRLGDLLDMSVERAVPLLFRATTPLPTDSVAHWNQYQRIMRRTTAWDKIEIHAQCHTQEEHRFLQDWCEWLVDELKNAEVLMVHAERHNSWRPPLASMGEATSTVVIEKAPGATYKPVKWKLTLDHDSVLERLIKDVYDDTDVFLRELIQNAADANRCRMLRDLEDRGEPIPDDLSHVSSKVLECYPIKVTLETRSEIRELTGEPEDRQVLIVDDCGVGMNTHVITNYFLQIGRSFYTSDEFQREYRFTPTSRFGVGFLSVFAVSDKVIVETYNPTSSDGPLRLTLHGPKPYLLVEQGRRSSAGTRIEVWLQGEFERGHVRSLVERWCRRVEFPVVVNDQGDEVTIQRETPGDFVLEVTSTRGMKYVIQSFPTEASGINGEIYILGRVGDDGHIYWDVSNQDVSYALDRSPVLGHFPKDLECFHGVAFERPHQRRSHYHSFDTAFTARLDYRGPGLHPTLSRTGKHETPSFWFQQTSLEKRLLELLKQHLDSHPVMLKENRWVYLQHLVEHFPFELFWEKFPGMIPGYQFGESSAISLAELNGMTAYTVVFGAEQDLPHMTGGMDGFVINGKDFRDFSIQCRHLILSGRECRNIRWLRKNCLAAEFISSSRNLYAYDVLPTAFGTPNPIGLRVVEPYDITFLNTDNPYIQWALRVKDAGEADEYGLNWQKGYHAITMFIDSLKSVKDTLASLKSYVDGWRKISGLPPSLYPPEHEITRDMFDRSKCD